MAEYIIALRFDDKSNDLINKNKIPDKTCGLPSVPHLTLCVTKEPPEIRLFLKENIYLTIDSIKKFGDVSVIVFKKNDKLDILHSKVYFDVEKFNLSSSLYTPEKFTPHVSISRAVSDDEFKKMKSLINKKIVINEICVLEYPSFSLIGSYKIQFI